MTLSVIIPVYNERASIGEVLGRVRSTPYQKQIIVVDDYSTDGTREWLMNHSDDQLQVLLHDRNRGKGAAIQTGLRAATGDVVVIQDADMEYDPADWSKMIPLIDAGKADVVFGSRFSGSDAHRVLYFWHMVGNKLITLVSNMFTNLNLTDVETCYKMFRRDIAQKLNLQEQRFGIEIEMTAKIAKLKCRIYEVGISYAGRTYEEGKKIGWRDGLRAFYCILKYGLR